MEQNKFVFHNMYMTGLAPTIMNEFSTATRHATQVNSDCHTSLSYQPPLEQLGTLSLLLWIDFASPAS